MYQVILIFSLLAFTRAQNVLIAPVPQLNSDLAAPTPYSFSYSAPADGGGSSHEQTGDEYGRVTGSYSVYDEDGRQRIVNYIADEGGFRASISTNEPGTSSQNPADVTIESSADNDVQAFTAPAPAPAVIPVAPIARPISRIPVPQIAPVRPALIPFQPTIVPGQPAVIPFQPTLQPQPIVVPIGAIGGSRFVNLPLSPISGGQIAQPSFIPIPQNFNNFGNRFVVPITQA